MENIRPGLMGDVQRIVTVNDTAERWGSGLVPVLGTPSLVALMENAAVQALEGHLQPGQTSVGTKMDVSHLAPTPMGMKVHVRAELREVDGRRLMFDIKAWDKVERIGEATHERFVIEREPFVLKAEAKAS